MASLPLRVCLLGSSDDGHTPALVSALAGEKCCEDCHEGLGSPQPCCLQLKQLPDASVPAPSDPLPPALVLWLPVEFAEWLVPTITGDVAMTPPDVGTPIRGPSPPAARRALLEVWTI
jgi:hypothetical protein